MDFQAAVPRRVDRRCSFPRTARQPSDKPVLPSLMRKSEEKGSEEKEEK